MRVLVATWGWRSQFYPLVPMAWALVAAGHEVRVACPPSLVADVVGAGLPAVAVGADVGFAEAFTGKVGRVGAPGTPPAITADGGVVALADAMLDDLLAYARGFAPALVVHEMLNLAATVTAAVLGVPSVRVLWGPDSSTALDLDAAALLGPRAARFGVDAVPDPAGTLTLDPCPPGLGVAPTGRAHPMRHLPYNGPAVLPDWLRTRADDRPLVCLTAGTMMAGLGLPDRFGLRRVAGALVAGGAEVVVAVEPSQVPGLAGTPGVRVALPPLALHLVLSQCAALVHQGGAGTLMAGLAAGVPQLVLPQVSDQHFNAARLAAVGAGTSLEPVEATDAALGAALASLLDPGGGPALAAAAVRAAFAALPAPAAVVGVLEDLAHEGAP